MSVGPEGYHYLTKKLMKIAPLIVVLEGGYNLKSISWAAESVMAALVDE
jgi:acetoin utilization deacetylase AcuC-like enzyme